jgi:hypothetical protein
MVRSAALELDLEGFQEIGAFADDGLSGLHPGHDHHVTPQFRTPAHGAEDRPIPHLDEDPPGAFHLLHGALGQDDGLGHGHMDFQGRAGDR